MAQAPLRPCPAVGCRELTRGGRCEKHKQQQRREHEGSEGRLRDQRFYSTARWKLARAVKLGRDPLCEEHLRQGRTVVATQVHHKVPRKDRPDLSLVVENLESLCASCHSKESMRERHGSNDNRGIA